MVNQEQLAKLSDPNYHAELGIYPKWRIGSKAGNNFVIMPYYDADQVEKVLNNVCGLANWQCETRSINGKCYNAISINTDEGWIYRDNAGAAREIPAKRRNSMSEIELKDFYTKTEATSAFVRAGARWGIASHLSDLPEILLEGAGYGKVKTNQGQILSTPEQISSYCNGFSTTQWLLKRIYFENKAAFEANKELTECLTKLREGIVNV